VLSYEADATCLPFGENVMLQRKLECPCNSAFKIPVLTSQTPIECVRPLVVVKRLPSGEKLNRKPPWERPSSAYRVFPVSISYIMIFSLCQLLARRLPLGENSRQCTGRLIVLGLGSLLQFKRRRETITLFKSVTSKTVVLAIL